jgi:hypothetical protein
MSNRSNNRFTLHITLPYYVPYPQGIGDYIRCSTTNHLGEAACIDRSTHALREYGCYGLTLWPVSECNLCDRSLIADGMSLTT